MPENVTIAPLGPHTRSLVEKLRALARGLESAGVPDWAAEFSKFAGSIEASPDSALKQFHDYTRHWKGMRDVSSPLHSRAEWKEVVRAFERDTVLALRERGVYRPKVPAQLLLIVLCLCLMTIHGFAFAYVNGSSWIEGLRSRSGLAALYFFVSAPLAERLSRRF